MHIPLPILVSLLTTTALSLPTTNTTTTLTPRARSGWIGAFQNAQCTGPDAPGDINLGTGNYILTPKHCYKWSPVGGTSYIGINYGSQWKQVTEITFFSDDSCKVVNGAHASVFQPGYMVGMSCTAANENSRSFKIGGVSD